MNPNGPQMNTEDPSPSLTQKHTTWDNVWGIN